VYCFEEIDNGTNLAAIYLSPNAELREEWNADLFGGTMMIHCKGKKLAAFNTDASFSNTEMPRFEDIELSAIPYGSWCNRKAGERIVWLHELM
jgi:DUF1680 family protein